MDGDIDVYKHFAWLKRVSAAALSGSPWRCAGGETLGGVSGEVFVRQPCPGQVLHENLIIDTREKTVGRLCFSSDILLNEPLCRRARMK